VTDSDFIELGKRAVACRHWRWLPGMLTLGGFRILRIDGDDAFIGPCLSLAVSELVGPDLRDPCMLGGLLALVREAWGHLDTNACKTSDGRLWGVRCPGFAEHMGVGSSEAEALVAALEAAPA